jgi:hypothetical protein
VISSTRSSAATPISSCASSAKIMRFIVPVASSTTASNLYLTCQKQKQCNYQLVSMHVMSKQRRGTGSTRGFQDSYHQTGLFLFLLTESHRLHQNSLPSPLMDRLQWKHPW